MRLTNVEWEIQAQAPRRLCRSCKTMLVHSHVIPEGSSPSAPIVGRVPYACYDSAHGLIVKVIRESQANLNDQLDIRAV